MTLQLNELLPLRGALNNVRYWSRKPGHFVDRSTGEILDGTFVGTVREWYETLAEVINDCFFASPKNIKKLVIVPPDILVMLESGLLYKPSPTPAGAEGDPIRHVGYLLSYIEVYCDYNMPRNKLLVHDTATGYSTTIVVLAMDII